MIEVKEIPGGFQLCKYSKWPTLSEDGGPPGPADFQWRLESVLKLSEEQAEQVWIGLGRSIAIQQYLRQQASPINITVFS